MTWQVSEATARMAEDINPSAVKHPSGSVPRILQPAIPSAGLSRTSSCPDAALEVAKHASIKTAASPAADNLGKCPPVQPIQEPTQEDDRSSRPASATGSGTGTDGNHAPANWKQRMVAISMYPAGFPASQIQMHAAASAALCGRIQQVRLSASFSTCYSESQSSTSHLLVFDVGVLRSIACISQTAGDLTLTDEVRSSCLHVPASGKWTAHGMILIVGPCDPH